MSFSLGVFLESVGYFDDVIAKVLVIHSLDRRVRGVEAVITDEAMALAFARVCISGNFGTQDQPKSTERVIKRFFVYIFGQIPDPNVRADFLDSFVLACLVDLDWLTEEFDHVHDFDRIVCVFFCLELYEPKSTVISSDLIPWHLDRNHWPTLKKKLPDEFLRDLHVTITYVECRLLVTLVHLCDVCHF